MYIFEGIVIFISFLLDGYMIFYLWGSTIEIFSGQVGLDQLTEYLGPIGLVICFTYVLAIIKRKIKAERNINNENDEVLPGYINIIVIFSAIIPAFCVLTGEVIVYALGIINEVIFVSLGMISIIVLEIADILYNLNDFFIWRHTRTKKSGHDDNEDQVSGKNDAL